MRDLDVLSDGDREPEVTRPDVLETRPVVGIVRVDVLSAGRSPTEATPSRAAKKHKLHEEAAVLLQRNLDP